MVKCIVCKTEYGFCERWNQGVGLTRFAAQSCSETCSSIFVALPNEEQMRMAKAHLEELKAVLEIGDSNVKKTTYSR